jgi:hypothetical protein
MSIEPPPLWMSIPEWIAAKNVTQEQIAAAESCGLSLPIEEIDGTPMLDTRKGYVWLQLLELHGGRPRRTGARADPGPVT